jgi:hypothetical protein
MFTCPKCQSADVLARREHTLWESMTLTSIQADGCYEEADAGSWGETIDQGPWVEAQCADCEEVLDIAQVFPAQDMTPEPTTVHIVRHEERAIVGVYPTQQAAQAAIAADIADDYGFDTGSEAWHRAYNHYDVIETTVQVFPVQDMPPEPIPVSVVTPEEREQFERAWQRLSPTDRARVLAYLDLLDEQEEATEAHQARAAQEEAEQTARGMAFIGNALLKPTEGDARA